MINEREGRRVMRATGRRATAGGRVVGDVRDADAGSRQQADVGAFGLWYSVLVLLVLALSVCGSRRGKGRDKDSAGTPQEPPIASIAYWRSAGPMIRNSLLSMSFCASRQSTISPRMHQTSRAFLPLLSIVTCPVSASATGF
ncbi:hypothetical protein CC80DRAFT_28761 [Byssothecium circinans]|uniref:Uncharacterized protein n=1 Tax=Byssothecium circinans TaxID=147558 RepID=A0A6A5U0E1_9PLEO|nr:hypothetical protein CC80DRAFT_28761 [Byssothecium circinans]